MPTPDERVDGSIFFAHKAIVDALNELQFTAGLAIRLKTLNPDAQVRTEYLVTGLAMLYEVRDVIENALPTVSAAQEEEGDG